MRLVADYGCGRGPWCWPLCDLNEKVIGIDISENYISTGQRLAQAAGISNLDMRCAPDMRSLPTGSVDGIISIGTLQVLVTGDRWHAFFADAYRVLSPGGRVLVNFSSPRFALLQFVTLEGFRHGYLRKKGLRWCIDRAIGWLRIAARDGFTREISVNGTYYTVRHKVVLGLIRKHGFREVSAPEIKLALQSPVPSNYRGRFDNWCVLEKAPRRTGRLEATQPHEQSAIG